MLGDVAQRLQRIAEGDAESKAWLFDRFAGRLLRRLGARYGPLKLEAEELLQEAFVFYFQHDARVLRGFVEKHPPEQQSAEALEAYLWDLACGVASNQLRARRVRRQSFSDLALDQLDIHGGGDPEAQSVWRDLLDQFGECLQKRGVRLHLYFILRFVDGLSVDEISAATGWEVKTVYKLRERLNEAAAACARMLGIKF